MATPSPQTRFHPLLEQAYTDGRAHYGELGLGFEGFSLYLLLIVEKHVAAETPAAAAAAFFRRLHAADLYLACACAERRPAGWECFRTCCWKHIFNLASFFAGSRDLADDLAGEVIADLYVPDGLGRSRIASYDGLSSLARWLRVIVGHRATDEHRRKGHHLEPLDRTHDRADKDATDRLEAALRASCYGPLIEDVLEVAAGSLTASERLVVLLRYEEGLRVNDIARLRRVNASAVTRQLARVERKLRREITSALRSKHGLTEADVEECVAEILENPAYSLLALLKRS